MSGPAHYDPDDYDFGYDTEDPDDEHPHRCQDCGISVPTGASWCDVCAQATATPPTGETCAMCEIEPPTEHYGLPVCADCFGMLQEIDAGLAELEAVDPELAALGAKINSFNAPPDIPNRSF